ncbi:MAG: acyl-CoA thioesterase [Campylobacteraceae bacterium]
MCNAGRLRIRVVAMPKDTNASGNIFGGWIMSQIDIAGSLAARDINPGNIATIAVNSLEFKKAVKVGDAISCYGKIVKVGNTSIQTKVEVYAERTVNQKRVCVHVTSAVITYVCVDENGEKKAINKDEDLLRELGVL